jgi:zinc transport system permease protein
MLDQLLTTISFPFVQRAITGGLFVALATSLMGILVVLRRSSFYGDAVAHASLTGVALGIMLGLNPILVAALYAVFVSFLLPYLKKHSELPIDSLLGFILPFSMGIGVILLAIIPGYQPELMSFLFGSILAIGWNDIVIIVMLTMIVLVVHSLMSKQLILTSFDEDYAKISGINVERINMIYSVLLGVTIVAGIRLVGIILVNALLVIPASTARLAAGSLRSMFTLTPLIAISITIIGLIISFLANLPSGPTIAVTAGIVFLLGIAGKKYFGYK